MLILKQIQVILPVKKHTVQGYCLTTQPPRSAWQRVELTVTCFGLVESQESVAFPLFPSLCSKEKVIKENTDKH